MALTAYQRLTSYIKSGSTVMLIQSERDVIDMIRRRSNEDDKLAYRMLVSDISRELHSRGMRYCFSCAAWVADHQDGDCENGKVQS